MAEEDKPPLPLQYHEKAPPLAVLAIAKLTQTALAAQADAKFSSTSQPVLHLPDKEQLAGKNAIVRYLVRSAHSSQLAGSSVLASVQVDHWLEYSNFLVPGLGMEAACAGVNDYLALRTFLAGHEVTAADVACWGQLQGSLQWDGIRKSGSFSHLARWYDHLSTIPQLAAVAEQYGPKRRQSARADSSKDAAKAGKEKGSKEGTTTSTEGSFDIGLGPEWAGRVVTRFPPEPSGFLHIGHAKALILNQQIAAANKGRMLVRFDDTNPDKEKDVFVDSILHDISRLKARPAKVTYTSDYFPQMLDLAERLIRAGHLYADDTPQEKMKEERLAKQPSQRRHRSVEENLRIWKEMVAGSKEGFANCLRFKIDPTSDNGTLRDPVAYRCNATPHLHTGIKYKVYPTYDCACPFVDSLEGVTHALRTSEYRDREEQFYRILKMQQEVWPGLPDVAVWDYSRLSFVNTVLSKRKLTKLVNMGAVEGWDDPRMPTVQGLLRRGMQVEALRDFILTQGASKNITYQEWDKIWTFNKKIIDPVCPRHTAVKSEGKVLLKLRDVSQTDYVTVDRHKKHPPAGKKTTMRSPVFLLVANRNEAFALIQEIWLDQEDAALLQKDEEVTLMDWGNAIIRVIDKDAATGHVTGLEGETHLEGSVKTTKWKLTWLADSPELIPLTLVDFDHLITKKKLEDDDEIEDLVNPCSRWETEALGDANMRVLQRGEVIQLERKGYYIVDRPLVRSGKPMVLFNIPDGRVKSLGAKPPAATQQAATAAASAEAVAKAAAKPAANRSAKVTGHQRKPSLSTADTPVSTKVVLPASNGPQNRASSGAAPANPATAPALPRESAPSAPSTSSAGMGVSEARVVQNIYSRPDPPPSSTPPVGPSTPEPAAAVGGGHDSPATSRPIPVPTRPSTEGTPGELKSGSVPPTPANTPAQISVPIPNPHARKIAEQLSRVSFAADTQPGPIQPLSALSRGSSAGSELAQTPNNTPATSAELPADCGERLPMPSPLQPKNQG